METVEVAMLVCVIAVVCHVTGSEL